MSTQQPALYPPHLQARIGRHACPPPILLATGWTEANPSLAACTALEPAALASSPLPVSTPGRCLCVPCVMLL